MQLPQEPMSIFSNAESNSDACMPQVTGSAMIKILAGCLLAPIDYLN